MLAAAFLLVLSGVKLSTYMREVNALGRSLVDERQMWDGITFGLVGAASAVITVFW